MKALSLMILAAILCVAVPRTAYAAALETADLTGTGTGATAHHGVTAITDALAAVSDGGTVQITEAGTYNALTLVTGKSYTIQGMVSGVIVGGSANTGTAPSMTVDWTGSTGLNCTLKNFKVLGSNTGNGNGCFDIPAQPTTNANASHIIMDQITVQVDPSLATINQRGVYYHAPATGATVPSVTLDVTNSEFDGGNTGGNAFVLYSTATPIAVWTANFTTCTFHSPSSECLYLAGSPSQTWNFNACNIEAVANSGFVIRNAISNATFNLNDCTLKTKNILFRNNQNTGTAVSGNSFTFNRCTIERLTYGASADTTNMVDFNLALGTSPNTVKFYNCLIQDHDYAGTNISFNLTGVAATFDYCTIMAGATGAPTWLALGANATADVNNNIIGNYATPVGTLTGTIGTALKNMIVGPTDSTALGTGAAKVYVAATAGIANATTAILLDPATYVPLSGSPAINAANPDATVLAAVGSRDRLGHLRVMGTGPDLGAFESAGTPPVIINPVKGFTLYH